MDGIEHNKQKGKRGERYLVGQAAAFCRRSSRCCYAMLVGRSSVRLWVRLSEGKRNEQSHAGRSGRSDIRMYVRTYVSTYTHPVEERPGRKPTDDKLSLPESRVLESRGLGAIKIGGRRRRCSSGLMFNYYRRILEDIPVFV